MHANSARITNENATRRLVLLQDISNAQNLFLVDCPIDLSLASGPVTITAESSDGFNGLTRLYMYELDITTANVDNATALQRLYLFSNQFQALFQLKVSLFQ